LQYDYEFNKMTPRDIRRKLFRWVPLSSTTNEKIIKKKEERLMKKKKKEKI